jgi:hypothetical protein
LDDTIQRTIEHLREQLTSIDGTIAALEKLHSVRRSPRGRKSMGTQEQLKVSERMKRPNSGPPKGEPATNT